MKKIGLYLLAGLVSLSVMFVSSCAYKSIKHGTEISEDQVTNIIDGKTTKEDVLVEFGDPTKTMNDGKAYFYSWTRGSKSSFIGFGGGTAFTKSLVVIFDEDGIVKTHKISRGTTQGGSGIND